MEDMELKPADSLQEPSWDPALKMMVCAGGRGQGDQQRQGTGAEARETCCLHLRSQRCAHVGVLAAVCTARVRHRPGEGARAQGSQTQRHALWAAPTLTATVMLRHVPLYTTPVAPLPSTSCSCTSGTPMSSRYLSARRLICLLEANE